MKCCAILMLQIFICNLASAEEQIVREKVDALTGGNDPYRSVAAIYYDGAKTFFYALGPDAIAPNSIVEIGSNTKVFTGLMFAKSVVEGRLALSSTPNAAFGADKVPAAIDHNLTLLHLATHSSGLPRLPDNLPSQDPADPYAGFTGDILDEYLLSLQHREPMPTSCVASYLVDPEKAIRQFFSI